MSASIYWRPVANNRHSVPASAPSGFVAAMERAFGAKPWHLDGESCATLRGMAAAHGGLDRDNPFQFLLDKIESVDGGESTAIEVWAEY